MRVSSVPAASAEKTRGGFTMVELLMVITIIGLLTALLLSAVQSSRASARRAQCLYKMKEIGQHLIAFENQQNKLPGWKHYPFAAINAYTNKPINYSTAWFPQLLPFLGRNDLFDASRAQSWKRPLVFGNTASSFVPALHEAAVCPADMEKMESKNPELSYVVNCGRADKKPSLQFPSDHRANGLFFNLLSWRGTRNFPVKISEMRLNEAYVKDGLTQTGMLSENTRAGLWYEMHEGRTGFIFTLPSASGRGQFGGLPQPYSTAAPHSNHYGGVNAVFADGHGQFVRDDIDYLIYCALLTSNGAQAKEPGSNTPTPDPRIVNQPKIVLDDLQ